MKRPIRKLRAGSSLVLFSLALLASANAQPLELPPIWNEVQCVRQMSMPVPDAGRRLETDFHLLAHTNVRPLLKKEKMAGELSGGRGYYRFATLQEIHLSMGSWRLRYAFGVADRYDGDSGAVQLYLYGVDAVAIPTEDVAVQAFLNRSAVNRWTIEHEAPVRSGAGMGKLVVAGSLYLSRRVQQGRLEGMWQNAQFNGNMVLDSTRGLDPAEARSVGAGIHLALSLPLSEQWQVGFWGENLLGRIWQRKIRRITAQVQANTIVPDADGFLHAAPLLSGRIDDLSRDLSLRRRYTIGLAYRRTGETWLAFASCDGGWRFAVGRTLPGGWLLWNLPDGEVQVAWGKEQWQVLVGLAHPDPSRTKHATFSVRWCVPLHR